VVFGTKYNKNRLILKYKKKLKNKKIYLALV